MKKIIVIDFAIGGLCPNASEPHKFYVVEKVNSGTHFIKPDIELVKRRQQVFLEINKI